MFSERDGNKEEMSRLAWSFWKETPATTRSKKNEEVHDHTNARKEKTIQVECEVADVPLKILRNIDTCRIQKTLEDNDQRSEDVDVDFNRDVMYDRKQEEKPGKDLTLNENGKIELEMHTASTVAERKDAA